MAAKIIGTGSYVPDQVITNDDLSEMVDTSDAWIRERTGIRARRITETGTADMAARAALKAMENAGISGDELDLIIVGTSTGDWLFPSTACEVQAAVGAGRAVCFDLSAACSGFLFSLNTAAVYLDSGAYRTALVVGADSLSKTVDWKDRSTCILFGDGAGAAVLRREESAAGTEKTRRGNSEDPAGPDSPGAPESLESGGIGPFFMGSDGNRSEYLTSPSTSLRNMFVEEKPTGYMAMNGQEVFKFAVKTVPEAIGHVLAQAGLALDDIKYFVLHQANERIIASVAKRMTQPMEKFPVNLDRYGNTSGASIPILLDELNRKGMLRTGDRLVLSGFGAGLTWGASVVTWQASAGSI